MPLRFTWNASSLILFEITELFGFGAIKWNGGDGVFTIYICI